MASEDSDQLVSGFLAIHGLGDLRDLDETFDRLVPAGGDKLDAASELLEFCCFGLSIGCRLKNGMMFSSRSNRFRTT